MQCTMVYNSICIQWERKQNQPKQTTPHSNPKMIECNLTVSGTQKFLSSQDINMLQTGGKVQFSHQHRSAKSEKKNPVAKNVCG